MTVRSKACDGRDSGPQCLLCGLGRQQAVPVRLQQFVDVDEFGDPAGADHQVKVVILGLPAVCADGDGANVEVVVLITFVPRIEVKDVGAQTQRRQ